MEKKILLCDNNDTERLRKLAAARSDNGDFVGALGFLFRALENGNDPEVITDIADAYADMELFELSNKFWFIYLANAPKDKESIAYEELGINYFYMDNLYMSGYYFHKKYLIDGYISQEGLDPDIVDYFSGVIDNKDAYRVAYPPERADYSYELKEAKRAVIAADYERAEKLLERIPEGCTQYAEAMEELSMLKFLTGSVDEGINVCRAQLNSVGDNIAAYCNLSSMYHYKSDDEKSRYYYVKALEQPLNDISDYYKLATCSLEQKEHLKAIGYMERIITERPYETNIRYLNALALLNCGKFERAEREFSYLYRLKPWDGVVKYYAALAGRLIKYGDKDGVLPLDYIDEVPETEEVRRLATLKDLPKLETDKINRALKNPDNFDCVVWGLTNSEESVEKLCVLVLMSSTLKKAHAALTDVLIDPDAPMYLKEIIVYVLIISGHKKSLSLTKGGVYLRVKPKKLRFEKMPEYEVFFLSYAFCFSRLAVSVETDLEKTAFATERVFKKLKDKIDPALIGKEELAALITVDCKFKGIGSERRIARVFGADYKKYVELKKIYDGE